MVTIFPLAWHVAISAESPWQFSRFVPENVVFPLTVLHVWKKTGDHECRLCVTGMITMGHTLAKLISGTLPVLKNLVTKAIGMASIELSWVMIR